MTREKSFKQMHLTYLKRHYGPTAEKWAGLGEVDDRLVFVILYRNMVAALESLPEEPHAYVCVAVSNKMQKDRETMDEIREHFEAREGRETA